MVSSIFIKFDFQIQHLTHNLSVQNKILRAEPKLFNLVSKISVFEKLVIYKQLSYNDIHLISTSQQSVKRSSFHSSHHSPIKIHRRFSLGFFSRIFRVQTFISFDYFENCFKQSIRQRVHWVVLQKKLCSRST